jgi:DnaJ-class molecular chaperone
MKVTIRQVQGSRFCQTGSAVQMQSVCPECRGSGKMISEKDKCVTRCDDPDAHRATHEVDRLPDSLGTCPSKYEYDQRLK